MDENITHPADLLAAGETDEGRIAEAIMASRPVPDRLIADLEATEVNLRAAAATLDLLDAVLGEDRLEAATGQTRR